MHTSIRLCLTFCALISLIHPAQAHQSAVQHDLDSVFTSYELVEIDSADMAQKSGVARRMTLRLGGVSRELDLVPHDLRAQSYRSTKTTDDGIVYEAPTRVQTYKGTIAGVEGSDVRLLIRDDMVLGYVRTPDDMIYLEPARNYEKSLGPQWVVAYRDTDVRPERVGTCGATSVAEVAQEVDESKAGTSGVDGLRILEIATDADFEYFQKFGDNANSNILGILNQVDGIYTSELSITVRVTFQNVFATSSDPYTKNDAGDLLSQFTFIWNNSRVNINRDLAHLFTGRNLNGSTIGIAGVAVVCNDNRGYGLSMDIDAGLMSKLTAHEIGHNLGSKHDKKAVCRGSGQLMCPSVQGFGPLTFSTQSKNAIGRWIAFFGNCLDVTHDDAEIYTTDGSGGISELNGFEGFRETWDIVVPGDFGGDATTDLLFYDRAAGRGEFFTTDRSGAMTQLRLHVDWDKTWDIIVPGDFGGDGRTDLLFYDRETGTGLFYTTDGSGGIALLGAHGDWDRTWDLIIPGQFAGDGRTDLLFYDREGGIGSFWSTDGLGGIAPIRDYLDWDKTWASIVPGDFGGDGYTDLFFYNRAAGLGELYTTDGGGGIGLLGSHGNLDRTWDIIVPGQFAGDGWTDLVFYDREGRLGTFTVTDGLGGLTGLSDHGGWRESWMAIVPGDFGADGFTDLFFYER